MRFHAPARRLCRHLPWNLYALHARTVPSKRPRVDRPIGTTYDLIAVGGGTAGLVAAAGGAGLGARVLLIERDRLGGECLWTGCVPSKALIASAGAASRARRAGRLGVRTGEVSVDFAAAMAWVREAQNRVAPHDSPERFRALGVEVVKGHARFSGSHTLRVNDREVTARHIILATGSRAAVPPVPGLDVVPYLTNETLFALERLPPTLLVLGAGPIGLELAQAFARLGSRVRVLEAAPALLPREDEELAAMLGVSLAADGVEILLGHRAERVSGDAGRVAVEARSASGDSVRLEGDALLVATGRASNVEDLELARAGVETGPDGITVDDRLRTTAKNVWAAGDVIGGLRFTHVADHEARQVLRNALFPFARPIDYRVVPWVTYTEPELAHVGLTEREARERIGDRVRVWRRPFDDVDRAIADDERAGMVKLVTDQRGRLLGGHVLGAGAGTMIGEIALAMRHNLPVTAIASTIHAYPTYPEAIRQASDAFVKSRFTGVARQVAGWLVRR